MSFAKYKWFIILKYLILSLSSVFVLASDVVDVSDFVVHNKVILNKELDGFDGTIEILWDKRLTDEDIKKLHGNDPSIDLLHSQLFKDTPLKQSIIRVKSNEGAIQVTTLEKPIASIELISIGQPHKRIALITQDFSIGMGSYNGPITQILEINSGSIGWARAHNLQTGKQNTVFLMRSLKTAWNFILNRNKKDILKVSCRPENLKSNSFVTTFSRYHYNDKGKGWLLAEKSEHGCWESDDSEQRLGYVLPDQKKFPQIVD